MGANYLKENLEKAKELRKNMTSQERKLWKILRNHQFYGFEIRRQYPIDKYIVDFICRSKKIIIEIDGSQHNQAERAEADRVRDFELGKLGLTVLRYSNQDIHGRFNIVCEDIMKRVNVRVDDLKPIKP